MSKSCTAMSLKMPPPPFTYSYGGGDGSREQVLMMIVSPTSLSISACLTLKKLGSNRLCNPVMSLTPASLHALIASTVSARSVAIGFSQKTCFPLAAHALICSAWYCEGEQIQTASTSGSVITSIASAVNFGTPNCFAAFSALLTVGFETTIGTTPGALLIAPKCTMPMRPHPITPTLTGSLLSVSTDIRSTDAWRGTWEPGLVKAEALAATRLMIKELNRAMMRRRGRRAYCASLSSCRAAGSRKQRARSRQGAGGQADGVLSTSPVRVTGESSLGS
mmetsp:Transcript_5583/g.12948  ORF Transcript_5583/g.12948 Transcript_5583/m.12948 type:complete len:278 (+) Transcript_5583:3070-3903(+)